MRTNIVIDDELIDMAKRLSGLSTKRAVVERALSDFVENLQRKNLLGISDKIDFCDDYNYKKMRSGR